MGFTPELSDFRGEWRLSRLIESDIVGQSGKFDGITSFIPDADGLLYREVGKLVVGDHEMEAERQYLWREDAGEIVVLFDDGKPFHRFASKQVAASHYCDPDTYNVTYDFSKWPAWSSRWRVTGPRKNYVMTSAYRRES